MSHDAHSKLVAKVDVPPTFCCLVEIERRWTESAMEVVTGVLFFSTIHRFVAEPSENRLTANTSLPYRKLRRQPSIYASTGSYCAPKRPALGPRHVSPAQHRCLPERALCPSTPPSHSLGLLILLFLRCRLTPPSCVCCCAESPCDDLDSKKKYSLERLFSRPRSQTQKSHFPPSKVRSGRPVILLKMANSTFVASEFANHFSLSPAFCSWMLGY